MKVKFKTNTKNFINSYYLLKFFSKKHFYSEALGMSKQNQKQVLFIEIAFKKQLLILYEKI